MADPTAPPSVACLPVDDARPDPTATAPSERLAGVTPLEWVALAVLGLALAIGCVRALQQGWLPVGDEALVEMRVRDVPSHLPLLGVYSRFGWSHPGPAQFLALALPYRLFGSAGAGLLVGAMVGHALAVGAAWWVARTVDRVAGVAVLVALELVLLSVPSELVRTAWNPYVALVMAGLMVVLAWGWAERGRVAAVLILPVGTLLVQSHIGNLPLVGGVTVVATVLAIWGHRGRSRSDEAPPGVPWRAAAWGAGVAAVLWIPPLVEQFTGDPGNVTRMAQDLSGPEPRVGVSAGAGLVSRFFAWHPAWVDAGTLVEQITATAARVPVWLVVPAAGAVVAVRRADHAYVRASLISATALVATVVATASIKGVVFSYLLVAHRSVVAVVMAVGLAAVARALPDRLRPALVTGGAAVAVGLGALLCVQQVTADNPLADYAPSVEAVVAAVREADPGDRPVHMVATPDDPSRDVMAGALVRLEDAGLDVTTVAEEGWRFGEHRGGDGTGALQVKVAPPSARQELVDDGWRVVDEYQPIPADQLEEIDRLTAERERVIAEGTDAPPGDPLAAVRYATVQDLAGRIAAIQRGRVPVLVAVKV